MPLEVGPPASAPVMAPEAWITAILFRPTNGPVNVLGESLAYFFRVTCKLTLLLTIAQEHLQTGLQ